MDITIIQPVWLPPNVDFLVDDCEKEWLQNDVDLAHFRFMAAVLKNPAKVLRNAFEYESFLLVHAHSSSLNPQNFFSIFISSLSHSRPRYCR